MVKLGVNIDHVATVRQARGGTEPNSLEAAIACEKAGADSITVHLREDRRHIQDEDVFKLKKILKTKLNLEMAAAPSIVRVALRVVPQQATLVPEKRQELTTEGGLDVARQKHRLLSVVNQLKRKRVVVSLFIEPDRKQVVASREIGADCVEFHTGRYANASSGQVRLRELGRLKQAAQEAHELGLVVNAGHGLNTKNIVPILLLPALYEVNIGHSIISRAVFVGLTEAVREMKRVIEANSAEKV